MRTGGADGLQSRQCQYVLKHLYNYEDQADFFAGGAMGGPAGRGISREVVRWYYLYCGYFSQEICSVRVVEPWKSNVSSSVPRNDQFQPCCETVKR